MKKIDWALIILALLCMLVAVSGFAFAQEENSSENRRIENLENQIVVIKNQVAQLESRVDERIALLENLLDDLRARVVELENRPAENYWPQIDNLAARIQNLENWGAVIDNFRGEVDAEFARLLSMIPENSPDWQEVIDNMQARYDGMIAQLKIEFESWKAEMEKGTDFPVGVIGMAAAIVILCGVGLKMGWFKGTLSSLRGPPVKVPMQDQIKRAINFLKSHGVKVEEPKKEIPPPKEPIKPAGEKPPPPPEEPGKDVQ